MRQKAYRLSILFAMLAAAAASAFGQAAVSDAWLIEVESDQRAAVRSAPLSQAATEFHAAGLRRRPDWKMPREGDPVQAIGFRARLTGSGASVTISELSGKRFGEKAKKIAQVTLARGEGRKVLEMADFGFESIILKLVPADPAAAKLPAILNPSSSVSATMKMADGGRPQLTIRFVNSSAKGISAVIWRTENAGRARLLGTAVNKYDEKLIDANGTYDLAIRADITDANGTRLFLDAVIFEDGTVHGDAQAADGFLRLKAGRRAALAKILSVLDAEGQAGSAPDLNQLISRVAGLKSEIAQTEGRPTTAEGFAFASTVDEAAESLRSLSGSIEKNEAPKRSLDEIWRFYRGWQARLLK